MGRITKIEEKLASLVEKPFRNRNGFDPLSIEISLKRLIEQKRKNILGRIVIPNSFSIIIDEYSYDEYEPFFDSLKASLERSLNAWIKEKGYEFHSRVAFRIKKGSLENRCFDIFAGYRRENVASPPYSPLLYNPPAPRLTKEGTGGLSINVTKALIGELIDKSTGEVFDIHEGENIIGRAEDCDITIYDPTVSEMHACIYSKHGRFILEDIGSRNGTRVNYEKVNKKVLADNNSIKLGDTELLFLMKKDD